MIFQEFWLFAVVSFLVTGVILLITSALLRKLIRCIDSIPVAYAWNPNSHDKMTSYAIDLLKNEEKLTMAGWIIKTGFERVNLNYFLPYMFEELRRGSIDEDMSSDAWKSKKLKLVRPWVETEEAKRDQSYEGTNGAYHFYNPIDMQGLNGKTENQADALFYLMAFYESDPKRISAVHRATITMTPDEAFLDNEARNYTQDDAERYFSAGHYHLSFYSMGRITHLLQDMAVPAHVRNSSHANRLDEPPEPLEYYADYKDEELLGSGRGKSDAVNRWSFDDRKHFIPWGAFDLNNSDNDPVYAKAARDYPLNKRRILKAYTNINERSVGKLMHWLATYIHNSYYSFGTIPCNADSRDPEHFNLKLKYAEDPDLKKCKVNPGALFDVLDLMIAESNRIINFVNNQGGSLTGIPAINRDLFPAQIIDRLEHLNDRIPKINSFRPDFSYFDRTNKNKWSDLEPLIKDLNDRWNNLNTGSRNLRSFLVFNRDLDKKLTGAGLQKAMEDWVKYLLCEKEKLMDIFKAPPKDDLISPPNNNKNRNWHVGLHGPYCLVNNTDDVKPKDGLKGEFNSTSHIIHTHYLKTQTIAIHFSAVLLSTWLEDQFAKSRRGLGLWINKDSPDSLTPPEPGPKDKDMNNIIVNKNKYIPEGTAFTIGIINHLPVEIDVDMTLTLNDISVEDAKEFPEGISLKTIMKTEFLKGKPDKHSEHDSNLRLKKDEPLTVKKVEKVVPYNISALQSIRIPPKLQFKRMGGMKPDEEKQFLHKIDDYVPLAEAENLKPAEPTPFELEFKEKGLDQPACVVLRFELGNDKKPDPLKGGGES